MPFDSQCGERKLICTSDTEYRSCKGDPIVKTCPSGTQCSNNSSEICTNSISTLTNPVTDVAFICTEAGSFVDPNSNCGKYFDCTQDPDTGLFTQVSSTCDLGQIFDVESSACTDYSEDIVCPKPPTCTEYQFYCVTDTVHQTCLDGQQYPSGATTACTANMICNMNCPSYCMPPSVVPSLCPEPTTTTATPAPPFECDSQGMFQNPQNCHSFIVCVQVDVGDYEPLTYNCPDGNAFDPGASTWVPEDLIDCTN